MNLMLVFFIAIVILSSLMVLIDNWRVILALMAGIYVFGALMIQYYLDFTYVVVFLISGWLTISILVIAQMNSESMVVSENVHHVLNRFFRFFSVIPIFLISMVLSNQFAGTLEGLSIYPTNLFIYLFGFAIFMAGFSVQSVRYIVSMLLFFMGFFVLYSSLNDSVFVIGMMSILQIFVAMIGAYLIMVGDLTPEGDNE
jgi:hypothetical protein